MHVIPHQNVRVDDAVVLGGVILQKSQISLPIQVIPETQRPVHATLYDVPGTTG